MLINMIFFMSEFKTTDIALAAALSLFTPMVNIESLLSGKSEFIFEKDVDTEKLVAAFWKGELLIEPKRYFDALRAVKSRLYNK